MEMNDAFEIRIASDPKFVKVIRCAIRHTCEVLAFPEAECRNITLAVDEAIANIIEHAYQWQPNRLIIIYCDLQKNCLEIVLEDFGKPTDPAGMKSRDLSDVRPGGLGMHFINNFMDKVTYIPADKKRGNMLTLVKYLPKKRKSDAEN